MKFFNLLITLVLFSTSAAQAKTESKDEVIIKQLSGIVLVDDGQGYRSAAIGMRIEPGQRIYVLETGNTTLATAGCSLQLQRNTLFVLQPGAFCEAGVARVKHMGNKVAAALGDFGSQSDVVPVSDDTSSANKSSSETINEEVVELEVNVEEPSLLSSIGSTLAIPAAVAGAVVFSVLAGGGGEEGDDPNPNRSPIGGLSAQ